MPEWQTSMSLAFNTLVLQGQAASTQRRRLQSSVPASSQAPFAVPRGPARAPLQAMAAEPGDPVDRVRKAINRVSPNLAKDFTDAQLQSLAAAGFKRPDQFRKVERKELRALGLTLAQAADLQQGDGGAGAPNPHGLPPGDVLDADEPMYQFVQALEEVRTQILSPIPRTVITLSCPWMGNRVNFGEQLYVRECYGEMLQGAAKYRERKQWVEGTIVAGTPGIGKSHMAGLVVAQLLLGGRAVMLEIAPAGSSPGSNNRQFYRMKLTDGKASVRFVEGPHEAHNWLRHDHKAVKFKQDKAPAYVVDGGVPSLPFGSFLNSGHCFWQFSSAQPDLRKEMKKGAGYLELFPPLFSLEELLHLKDSVNKFSSLSDARVIDAFAVVGGIARPVLLHQTRGQTVEDLRNSVRSKIITMAEPGATGWQAVYHTLKGDSGFHEGSDLLVHWDAVDASSIPPPAADSGSPDENNIRRYTKHRSQLASPYVAAMLSIHTSMARAEQAAMFAVSHSTRGGFGGMVGTVHEELSHIFLANGGVFECRFLGSGEKFTLTLPRSTDVEVFPSTAEAAKLATAPGASCYLMPASSSYPAVDSFKSAAIFFQMAAGKTHTINRPGLLQLIRVFTKEEMREAIRGLRGMTGLTARQLPGTKPVLFFATLPESFEDGFQALKEYVEGKKKAEAKGQLAHQAVLKIPHKLLIKMSVEEQAAIIIEIAKGLEELYKQVDEAGEGEEDIPAYSDEDMPDAE